VGSTNGNGGNGFILTNKPLTGDLLGTTITNYVPANKLVATLGPVWIVVFPLPATQITKRSDD